jgi:SagB-type dehydrogenase family enzyme
VASQSPAHRRVEPPRFRRTPHLVCHWEKGQFILHNYATGVRAPATPLVVEILDVCENWRAASDLLADLRAPDSTALDPVLSALVEHTFLERSDRPIPASHQLYAQWGGWRPAAAFFHAATKDMRYGKATRVDSLLRQKATADPPPSPLKPAGDAKRAHALPLPQPAPVTLSNALAERRTWRQFRSASLSQEHLATLLGLTFGVQQWIHVEGFNRMPLKTSPSGGARHAIEAYAYVRRVKGLRPGWYHYDPDRHVLQPIASRGRGSRKISTYLPTQAWYDNAAVLIAMTAVFARAQWRYGYPRAYRSVLAEAGHLAQTWCLLATSLGLAPFCSMALADSAIERDLGIDGVSEGVVYAAGAGHRPVSMDWAPWPDTTDTPRVELPTWKQQKQPKPQKTRQQLAVNGGTPSRRRARPSGPARRSTRTSRAR